MKQHPEFINNLIALKDYYQAQIEEYQRQFAHARKQLDHVNALLDDQMARQYKQSPPQPSALLPESASTEPATSMPSSTPDIPVPPVNWAVTESLQPHTAETATEKPPEQSAIPEKLEPVSGSVTQELLERSTEFVTSEQKHQATTEALQPPSSTPATPEPAEPAAAVSAVSESNVEFSSESPNNVADERSLQQQLELSNDEKRSHYVPPPKTSLLPQYQHFTTKSEAVEKFLQDNEGKIFSIDEITRALHGDLEPEAIKAERKRMYTTLNKGLNKGFWQAVPNALNYYTFNLTSVQLQQKAEPKGSASRRNKVEERKFRGKPATGVLPRYQNLSWSQAVETVVTEQIGQILTTDKITQILCGDLSGEALKQAKGKISRTLWSGANQGQWQRVPEQVGQYTLDLKLLNSKSTQASF